MFHVKTAGSIISKSTEGTESGETDGVFCLFTEVGCMNTKIFNAVASGKNAVVWNHFLIVTDLYKFAMLPCKWRKQLSYYA